MSEKKQPLLSIVIPTKNRYYYLKFIVEYFHSIQSDNIELVIQDNSDLNTNSEFLEYLNIINDLRIKYAYSEKDLSVVENSDLAILNATGEYITVIGDDDIFSKHIIGYTEFFKENGYDAVMPRKGIYTWPDVKPRLYKEKLSGLFWLKDFKRSVVKVDINKELELVLKSGGSKILKLPCVYHGIVKREILEKIYKLAGSFFPGPSPDMANAIALALLVRNYIIIDIPIIISGQSITSAAGKGAHGTHHGEISAIKHLPKDTSKKWTKAIPFYWSGSTIYAESVVQSLFRMGKKDLIHNLNYNFLYATCLVYDTNYRKKVFETINQHVMTPYYLNKITIGLYFIEIWINRIIFHLRNNLILVLPERFKYKKNLQYSAKNTLEVIEITDVLIANKDQL